MIQYKKIFSIQIKHLYYGTDQTKFKNDFDIVPTPETEVLLKNHGLVYKITDDSIVVLGNSIASGTKLLKAVSANTRLRFLLKVKNFRFQNFTDIPLTGDSGKIYYFNNRASHVPSGGALIGNKLLLPATGSHASDYVDGSERIEVLSEMFAKDLGVGGTNVKIVDVYDAANVVFDSDTTSLSGVCNFNLAGKVTPGRYKLMVGATQIGTDFYIDSALLKGGFGIIEVFEVSSVNSTYQYVNSSGIIQNPTYVLPFKNRSTTWKYIVSAGSSVSASALQIKAPGGMTFTPDVLTGVQRIFTASSPIALVKDTYTDIKLYKDVNSDSNYTEGTDVVILGNMPNPSVDIVKPGTGVDAGKIFSEIFVYV